MKTSTTNDAAPALLLMFFAPLITELLPGATRFSSLFVLPIEIAVWGGGAVMIRYVVRKRRLDWTGMVLLALALVIAEEFLIQQTSVAPLVIRLKGVTYARAAGINYVYLLWALIYESAFVVFLPVYLVELIFPARRDRPWINTAGFCVIIPLFLLGSLLAWYSWTQIARPKVFHMPAYKALLPHTVSAILLIGLLIAAAWNRTGSRHTENVGSVPPKWLLFISGACWATLLFGLVLLGFGINPGFPPMFAVAGAVILIIVALALVPRWSATASWQAGHRFALIAGVITGSMLISFVGFIGPAGPDLYFKIITNIIAAILLAVLAFHLPANNSNVQPLL